MLKVDKKQVKMISLAIVAFFVLSIVGIAVTQTSSIQAAAAGSSSNIGKVNHDLLISQHPDMAKAQETFQAEVQQAQKDFEAKTASMNDQEKQNYYNQVQQRLNLRQQELIAPIIEKVDVAIKAIADAKGLNVVLDIGNVVYGGQDITDEVGKKLTGK